MALWSVFGLSVVVAVVTVIAMRIWPEPALPAASGPVYPRMPAPRHWNAGELLRAMGIGSLTWYACILSAPLFIVLARRLPLERHRAGAIAVHMLVILVLITLTALLRHLLTYDGAPVAPPLRLYIQAAWLTDLLPFLAVAAGAQALEARARVRERELEAARMKSELAEARLASLTAQLQPHFLFNTLQAVSTLILHDPPKADRMVTSLSDLLRDVLRRHEREVLLEEELRVLDSYLDISRTRFGARLTITVDVTAEALQARVPFFMLQPLIENALQHGVGSSAGNCVIRIHAARQRDELVILVSDDGPGADSPESAGGIGLGNTRARLRELYGDAHTFSAAPLPGRGFEVRITLPFATGNPV